MTLYAEEIARSREHEMRIYVSSMRAMYENAVLQNGEIYDLCFAATAGFTRLTADAIVSDSRIVRILRYSVAPSISQMKFGQLFGLSSIEPIERDRIVRGPPLLALKELAPKLASFASEHLDRCRFIWIDLSLEERLRALAQEYARKWTCSLIADQNAQTAYRNWRKTQQETAIEHALVEMGYVRSRYAGDVTRHTDINIGEYSKERKVKGITTQKADLIVRRKKDGKLFLMEAKAVGVQLDAFKRIKECCDKARDWRSNQDLRDPEVVAVIGGFFAAQNIIALSQAGVSVVWEHDMSGLRRHMFPE